MKCSFYSLLALFGAFSSALCSVSVAQHRHPAICGPQAETCPLSRGHSAADTAILSGGVSPGRVHPLSRRRPEFNAPWIHPMELPCWLAAQQLQAEQAAVAAPSVAAAAPATCYEGCEAGCPEAHSCAAGLSQSQRDIWMELYSSPCCPERYIKSEERRVNSDATCEENQAESDCFSECHKYAEAASTHEPATTSELGCLAADERHSRGCAAAESLNDREQGLSEPGLHVRLRIGPVDELEALDEDLFAADAPSTDLLPPAGEPQAAASSYRYHDECAGVLPNYDRYGVDCCPDELMYECGVAPLCTPEPCQVESSPVAAPVANRTVVTGDIDADVFGEFFQENPPRVPEVIREDLQVPAWPAAEPWANAAIERANGRYRAQATLQGCALMFRQAGEVLRCVSHCLNEIADDISDDGWYDSKAASNADREIEPAADETSSAVLPDYLGW